MKKLIMAFCFLGAVTPIFAQKAIVDQASKLSGKSAQLEEARGLINQAMSNPETANEARTYYVAGQIELDAFDNGFKTKVINPDDPTAQPLVLAEEMMNAYNYFMKALPLDSLPDEKGKVKPKFSKDINKKIKENANNIFTAGADYFNNQKYPEALNAFMVFLNLPTTLSDPTAINPANAPIAAFYAGVAAYEDKQYEKAADLFRMAQQLDYDDPKAYIYEMACWQTMAQQQENPSEEIQANIGKVAQAGMAKYGLQEPVFINNYVNSLVFDEKFDDALALVNQYITDNPDVPNLYALRGFIYERSQKPDLAEESYRKAASFDNAELETLRNASKILFKIGTQKLNEIEGSSAEATSARENIKNNYFIEAENMAKRGLTMEPNDSDLQNVLESIEYSVTTYFN